MNFSKSKVKAILDLFSLPKFKFSLNGKNLETLIFQGGMGVDISTDKLALAVSKTGSAGTISTVATNYDYSNLKMPRGILGFNNLVKATDYEKNYELGKKLGVDYMISGAGTSRFIIKNIKGQREMLNKKYHYFTIPIISSASQLPGLIKRNVGIVILENTSAGGHNGIGLNFEDTLNEYLESKINLNGNKVIFAGGIRTPDDMIRVIDAGFNAVQLGTYFLLANETNVFDNYRQLIINAKVGDVRDIPSPAGLAASGFYNQGIMKKVLKGKNIRDYTCPPGKGCLSRCDLIEISGELSGYKKDFKGNYCIKSALKNLHEIGSNPDNSLYFSGKEPERLFNKEIETVAVKVYKLLEGVYDSIVEKKVGLIKDIPFLIERKKMYSLN